MSLDDFNDRVGSENDIHKLEQELESIRRILGVSEDVALHCLSRIWIIKKRILKLIK